MDKLQTNYPMVLKTDYRDVYDAFFDLEGPVFERFSRQPAGFPKMEQFRLLATHFQQPIPRVGLVRDLADCHELVVYIDEFGHAGNGKERMSGAKADLLLPNKLAAEFVRTHEDPTCSRSRKVTFIGNHCIGVEILCRGDWRTNSGDLEIEIIEHIKTKNDFLPLYSIDMIPDIRTGQWLSIDLNTAPGLRGLGFDELLRPREMAEAIKQWCYEHPDKRAPQGR